MKFILKDGTEINAISISYRHAPNESYAQNYSLLVNSESPQEDIDKVKQTFTPENLAAVRFVKEDGSVSYDLEFKKLISVDVTITETTNFVITLE